MKFQSALYNEHKVSPAPGSAPQGPYQLFAANQLAMFQSGFWGSGVAQFVEDPDTVGVAPMLIGPAGQRGSMFEFDPLVITSSSEHPEEAFKWVDYNTNYDAQLRVTKLQNVTASRPAVMAVDEVQENPTLQVFSGIMEEALPLVLPGTSARRNISSSSAIKFKRFGWAWRPLRISLRISMMVLKRSWTNQR